MSGGAFAPMIPWTKDSMIVGIFKFPTFDISSMLPEYFSDTFKDK